MSETKKIVIGKLESKTAVSFEGYIEIKPEYLYFFKNTWIKYTDKKTSVPYSGGNLSSIDDDTITLKNIRGSIFELNKKNYIFYCKETSEHYKALKEILIEREKLEIEKRQLREEKNNFIKEKKQFFTRNSK
jgi:hypothetical protein